eukprot:6020486-Pleurochrysis_carterae.AAC.5
MSHILCNCTSISIVFVISVHRDHIDIYCRPVVLARFGRWERKSVVTRSPRSALFNNITSRDFRTASRYERPAVTTLANGRLPRLAERPRRQTEPAVSIATHQRAMPKSTGRPSAASAMEDQLQLPTFNAIVD